MPEEILGKTFWEPGEEGAPPPLSQEELDKADVAFEAAAKAREQARLRDDPPVFMSRKFWDDGGSNPPE